MSWIETYFALKVIIPLGLFGIMALIMLGLIVAQKLDSRKSRKKKK